MSNHILEKFLIISSIGSDPLTISYVSNTSPICWTPNIGECKAFDSFEEAKNEIIEELDIYKKVVRGTDITEISVLDTLTWDVTTIIGKKGELLK